MASKGIAQAMKTVGEGIKRNSPTILTGLSVAGLITTAVMSGKATIKAREILAIRYTEEKEKNGDFKDFTWEGVVKETWKCYIPTALMGGTTITCMILANHINLRRNAALASVYSIAETTLREYQNKVVETIGENKEKQIRQEIAQDRVNKKKPDPLIVLGSGDVLCMDLTCNRYFKSSYEKIKRAENEINRELMNSMWLSLNEVYGMLNLEPTTIGWDIGWEINRDGKIDIEINTCISDDKQPCLTINFAKEPSPRY